jgi:hypothetical protein
LIPALRHIERALEAHSVVVLDLATVTERLAAELRTTAHERRQISETIVRLERQFVEMKRSRGERELHIPARHSRRRPLG